MILVQKDRKIDFNLFRLTVIELIQIRNIINQDSIV